MELHLSVAEFFHEEVTQALRVQRVDATEPTEFYLVNLLVEFAKSRPADERPLALQLATAKASAPDEKVRQLKEIGDTSLVVSGFFADSLARKNVGVDYYVAMGQSSYAELSGLIAATRGSATHVFRDIYEELSGKFARFVDVLHAIRARTSFATTEDLLLLGRTLH